MNDAGGSIFPDCFGLPVAGPRVLVVDGRAADALILSCYLQQFACPHDVASSFEDAITLIESTIYDAVIIDVAASALNAAELVSAIRRHEKKDGARRAHVIALAAFAPVDDPSECLKVGLDDYLSKPCNPRLLALKLGFKELSFAERWPTDT